MNGRQKEPKKLLIYKQQRNKEIVRGCITETILWDMATNITSPKMPQYMDGGPLSISQFF